MDGVIGPVPMRLLQVAVAAALLAVLWHVADGAAALGHLSRANPAWLGAAIAALTAQTVVSALRWRLTAAQLGITITPSTSIREYYLAQMINQTLPGGILGDAGRAVRLRSQAGLLASGQAVVFERLAGQLGLLCVFALAVLATLIVPGGFAWPQWLLWVVLPALLAVGVILGLLARPVQVGDDHRGFRSAALYALGAPNVRNRQIMMSLATALLNIVAFFCCAAAVGVALPLGTAAVLIPMILFAMLVPVSISGWGLREGAAAALMPLAGVSAAQGLAASVAFGLVFLVCALPGIVAAGLVLGRASLDTRQ